VRTGCGQVARGKPPERSTGRRVRGNPDRPQETREGLERAWPGKRCWKSSMATRSVTLGSSLDHTWWKASSRRMQKVMSYCQRPAMLTISQGGKGNVADVAPTSPMCWLDLDPLSPRLIFSSYTYAEKQWAGSHDIGDIGTRPKSRLTSRHRRDNRDIGPRRCRAVLRLFQSHFYDKFVERGPAKFTTSALHRRHRQTSADIGPDVGGPMSRRKPADVADVRGCATRHRRRCRRANVAPTSRRSGGPTLPDLHRTF
jgi:hypothetical protein